MTKKEIVENANSKGFIPDYTGVSSSNRYGFMQGRLPDFNTRDAYKVISNDPVVKGSLVTLVDKVMEGGWRVTGKDKKSRIKALETKLEDVRFDSVIRKALFNLFLYNNAFIEIVNKGEELTDLNVLETTLMEVLSDDHGNIVGYRQDVGADESNPEWKPEKVVHLKLREISNNVWSEPLDIKSLWETVLIKDYIRQWLMWFFGTNQLRGVFAVKGGANTTKIKDFMAYLKASEKDKTLPLVLQGEVVYQMLNNFDNGDKIQVVLDWCDKQILSLLQVPPIAIGQPDSSGRSNSVEQYQALNTTILSTQRVVEDFVTFDLFKKIGFEKGRFLFGVLDESSRMRVLEMVEKMVNVRFSEEAIKEFLEVMDWSFETKELFKPDPVELGLSNKDVGNGNEGQLGNVPQGDAPSRKGQVGNGPSEATVKEKEVVKNSKFERFPYVYEVRE